MSDFRETLYTIDKRGRRRWVYSSLVKGRWFRPRAAAAYLLMAFYLLMPWITINGMQGIHLDFGASRFTFFGTTFWATDTVLLVLVLLGLGLALFFFTAVFGRVWCGWACPETVFLEFLFRPIERIIEGSPAQRLRLDQGPWTTEKIWKKGLKHGLCALSAWVLASTALAYFVGRDQLFQMMGDWPHHNLIPFSVLLAIMGLMAFQFGYFREQFCTILCPYARFQSVLLDKDSLVVGYDAGRGEPRGKASRGKASHHKGGTEYPEKGDCIDCGLCLRVCPTGIDIRNGTQLECIACTACADACDSVMVKIGRPPGLIRYDSENGLEGQKRTIVRPRLFVYAICLLVIGAAFLYSLRERRLFDAQIVRGALDKPFSLLPNGQVSNHLHLRVGNKAEVTQSFTATTPDEGVQLIVPQNPFQVPAGALVTVPLFANFADSLLTRGTLPITVVLKGTEGDDLELKVTLLGPETLDTDR